MRDAAVYGPAWKIACVEAPPMVMGPTTSSASIAVHNQTNASFTIAG
jgi:hypothetical protein